MPTESPEKITIAWDDLKTRKVDQRLREHDALERNRRQSEMNPLETAPPVVPSTSIWSNAILVMALFGLLGGLLAWGAGETLRTLSPDLRAEARTHLQAVTDLLAQEAKGLPASQVVPAIASIKQEYSDNPFFALDMDDTLSPEQHDARLAVIDQQQRMKDYVTNMLSYGMAGLLIGACLSIAEPVADRNLHATLVNGFVGGSLGLVGGAFVSMFVNQLNDALMKGAPNGQADLSTRIFASAVSWGVLGLFLTVGPGLLMRNAKKLAIGLLGGLVGGLIGGALFDPIFTATGGSALLSRLAALVGIGLFAGLGTGLIENAAKSGWLKVTGGLIAGKQFILYRNPTFIGSGPECPIYLFRDPQVGRRHAAIHIVPGGFEIENLPLGSATLINNKNITRTRLRAGDEIKIGGTAFLFQEKVRK